MTGPACRRAVRLALGLLAAVTMGVHAQQSDIRTRLAGSDGGNTYYGVRCPDGLTTRVVVRSAPAAAGPAAGAPRVCFRPRGRLESCVEDASVPEVAVAACDNLQTRGDRGVPSN